MALKRKFYRQKYLISVYDEEDNCMGVFANRHEFAEAVNRANRRNVVNELDTDCTLNRIWKGIRKTFNYAGKRCTIHFIELTPEEVQALC